MHPTDRLRDLPDDIRQLIDYQVATAYAQGAADARRAADRELSETLTAVFSTTGHASSVKEAMGEHIRALDAAAARDAAASADVPDWRPTAEWADAVTRLPGESDPHYSWRCRRAARERAAGDRADGRAAAADDDVAVAS